MGFIVSDMIRRGAVRNDQREPGTFRGVTYQACTVHTAITRCEWLSVAGRDDILPNKTTFIHAWTSEVFLGEEGRGSQYLPTSTCHRFALHSC